MTTALSLAAANAMVAHAAELVVEDAILTRATNDNLANWRIEKLREALAERRAVLAGMSASDAKGTDAAKPQE